jgi:hypothetical protein
MKAYVNFGLATDENWTHMKISWIAFHFQFSFCSGDIELLFVDFKNK